MKAFCILLLTCLQTTLVAQWYWQNPIPNYESTLRSVIILDSSKVMIFGHQGIIYMSTNDGTSWGEINSGETGDFKAISFYNENIGIANTYGSILITTDAGWTWDFLQEPPGVHNYISCFMLDTLNIYIASGKWGTTSPIGVIYFTNDGGATWEEVIQFGQGNELKEVHFFNSSIGIVTTSDGKIFRTTDGGYNWVNTLTTTSGFRNLSFCDSLNGIADGGPLQNRKTFRTTDGGLSWQQLNSPPEYIDEILFLNENFMICVGANYTVYKSSDHGGTWIQLLRLGGGLSHGFLGVAVNGSRIFVVGDMGNIYWSSNSGDEWYTGRWGPTTNINAIHLSSRSSGIAAGSSGVILKTTNGGAEWNGIVSGFNGDFKSTFCIDSLNYIIAGSGGLIIKSTDRGNTWYAKNTGTLNTINKINLYDEEFGFAVGNNKTVLKTTDSGENWASIQIPFNTNLLDICIIDPSSVFILGENEIIRSLDGGITWDISYFNSYGSMTALSNLGSSGVIASGVVYNLTTLFKSTDLGNNWVQINTTFSGCTGISFVDSLNGLLCFSSGEIYRTTNGSNSWISAFYSDAVFYDIQMLNINDAAAVGKHGTIVSSITEHIMPVELLSFTGCELDRKVYLNWITSSELNSRQFEIEKQLFTNTSCGEWILSGIKQGQGTTALTTHYSYIENIGDIVSDLRYRIKQIDYDGSFTYSPIIDIYPASVNSFNLLQNYPNPFNPSTLIEYDIDVPTLVSLKVYDILGREAATLVREIKQPGKYVAEFVASGLSSGVYIYQLKANGSVLQKKMLLLR